ncbi:MAG: tryptophan--tRNA ligase [Gammaproteobacteria bacterium]|jgi:tryptophanyl-tRNA synthetase|nr:tryptophan--tRNA ligase [Gammaproteobacteria bacterium]MBT5542191.1 tryptophan--tRNA ligase [Gammaproteobacteria bacterium]MDG2435180.1 tryptophan--tRNA ligase [Gammaproteobacteria bacterium]
MIKKRVLTGITTTGSPHLGNYAGAIRQAVDMSRLKNQDSFYFLADYHALVKNKDPKQIENSCLEIAATWLALGLNPEKTFFYRQSDIPEILELNWILNSVTAKGLMNRAHAYKSAVDDNQVKENTDFDKGINMSLFSYPILMAADILMFKATHVPVGNDQKQHMEMVRDIAQRFNHHYGDLFIIPESVISEESSLLPGLDGRKMSKSYQNTIPLFLSSKKLRKLIMKIKTNSLKPGEPKSTKDCVLFDIFKGIASEEDALTFKKKLKEGIAWGEAKEETFAYIDALFIKPREEYMRLMQEPMYLQSLLTQGADKAREISLPYIKDIKEAVGIRSLG